MQDLLFSTASNVAIFLNGIHMDLAYGFNYKESSPKIPIYGYNDYTFRNTARGKTMVQGIIVCNFIYPGYLSAILNRRQSAYNPKLYNYNILENAPSVEEQFKQTIKRKLTEELPQAADPQSRAARAEFIASLITTEDPEQNKRAKEALINFMDPGYVEPEFITNKTVQSPLSFRPSSDIGNQLDVYYQDPEFASWFCRFTNVEFTESSQQISQAGAEGSSEPLYQIHQFIAKELEIKQVT